MKQLGISFKTKYEERTADATARSTRPTRGAPAKIERNSEITAMRESGQYTLDEIGKKFHITRERVRQISQRTGKKYPRVVHIKPTPLYAKKCGHCTVPFLGKRKDSYPKFCSKQCRTDYWSTHKKWHTEAERIEYHRQKTRIWAQRMKLLYPYVWKEVIRRRNAGEKGVSIRDYTRKILGENDKYIIID